MASPLYPVSTAQIRSTGLLDPRLLDHQIPSRPSASSSFNVDILPFYHPGTSGYTYGFSHSHKDKKEQGPSDAWKQGSEREVSSAQQSHQACGPISHTSEPNTVAKERKSTGQSETGLEILPHGMDITEALEKCEDPSLGWSLQFWVTIADPVNQNVFFACPANGHCSWDPPIGALIVPRSPDGEWWELSDTTRGNRSYYYRKTQWTRPSNGAFVIPLGLIQNALTSRNQLTPRESSSSLRTKSGSVTPQTSSPSASGTSRLPSIPFTPRSAPPPPSSPHISPSHARSTSSEHPQSPPLLTPTLAFPEALPTGSHPPLALGPGVDQNENPTTRPTGHGAHRVLSMVQEGDDDETDSSGLAGSAGGWWGKRNSEMAMRITSPKMGVSPFRSTVIEETNTDSPATGPGWRGANGGSNPADHPGGSTIPHLEPEPNSPIYVENVRTKRMSTGPHPLLPPAISSEIQNFQAQDFASKYFATKRKGMLRSRVPLEQIMEWQKHPITSPLLVLSRHLARDALTCFKVIQHVMGERDRVVENAKPVVNTVATTRKGRTALSEGMSQEKFTIFEEIRWVLQLAVSHGEMRDEVYCQLIKQLTKNPEPEAIMLGYQLFCVFLNAFPPSKNFDTFIKSFLSKEDGMGKEDVVMARYCRKRLQTMIDKGQRGRLLTIVEIEHASNAAFHPSVYGQTLEKTLMLQAGSYPELKVPVILPFLADGILALGGLESEGIFRVPGDHDTVSDLRARIDRGHYQLKGVEDPHVVASLLKLWLRELEEPIIPHGMYNTALTASRSTAESIDLVTRLPETHRRVLLFVISFAQLFLEDKVVQKTKMNAQNLALLLAPNLLRTTSKNLETVVKNAPFETKFVLRLLENMDPAEMDKEYVPTHATFGRG